MTEKGKLKAAWAIHRLDFKSAAGTSRGILTHKDSWLIKLWYENEPDTYGIGEASPLKGLSVDDTPDFQDKLVTLLADVHEIDSLDAIQPIVKTMPSLAFALETAFLDLLHGGQKQITATPFFKDRVGIPINGLVWMGTKESMLAQVAEKIEQGFTCIKLKIGAINFEDELAVLKEIRAKYTPEQISIRVDANGAFGFDAHEKLKQLADLHIHSIEQPVAVKQVQLMHDLCRENIVPVALDEELIGVTDIFEKDDLLETLMPQYIILKPTLLGGILATLDWIQIANIKGIGWWITSALESNIGLNAIAQFTSSVDNDFIHGLGTGNLYTNNFDSPLKVENGHLYYDNQKGWDLSAVKWNVI